MKTEKEKKILPLKKCKKKNVKKKLAWESCKKNVKYKFAGGGYDSYR